MTGLAKAQRRTRAQLRFFGAPATASVLPLPQGLRYPSYRKRFSAAARLLPCGPRLGSQLNGNLNAQPPLPQESPAFRTGNQQAKYPAGQATRRIFLYKVQPKKRYF